MNCHAGHTQCLSFLFNDPATTAIYTYCHPRSLHDALPILPDLELRAAGRGVRQDPLDPDGDRLDRRGAHPWQGPAGARSEEHTSELQSLMRISYAVFCLKKQNTYYR